MSSFINLVRRNSYFRIDCVYWNDVTEFEENATSEEIHDNCIDAIKSYSDVVEKTISYMQKDELI